MKNWKSTILASIMAVLVVMTFGCEPPITTPPDTTPPVSGECNRECLIGVMDSYLNALTANDPSLLNAANTLKYTDNGVEAQLGEGLWETALSVDNDKRLDFADPVQGNVATQVVIFEKGGEGSSGCGADTNGDVPVIYQVRLKVEQQVITEIEAMTVRRATAANFFFNAQNMTPEPVFKQEIAPEKRMSRAELKQILDDYVDYLDGDKSGKDIPFDAQCKRYENGVVTASGLAAFQMQSWFFNVTRRYPVIDEETGIIWGMLPFFQTDTSLVVGEAFKIIDGKIMMIQAVMAYMPSKYWD